MSLDKREKGYDDTSSNERLVLPEGKFEVQTVPVPAPASGEVLCRVRAVAICGSDPEILRGDLAGTWPPGYPFTPGHEWAGEVVALGPGVTKFQVGARVAAQAHKGCGICRNCMEGRYTICENYGRPETGQRH
jgi:L-iditol 2-dehydrogenase